jgi:hypothetical protein
MPATIVNSHRIRIIWVPPSEPPRLLWHPGTPLPTSMPSWTRGSVSFQGKLSIGQAYDYQKLYQAAEIKSRSAATRWTWMTRRRASETLWLM